MPHTATKRAWEEFRAKGQAPDIARAEIVESWRRSSALAVPARERAPLLAEAQLQQARAQSRRFLRAACPAVQKVGKLLNCAGRMILLSDAQGIIMDQVGDPSIMDMGRDSNLHSGGRWLEDDIGTNAIGTALRTGRPTQVFHAEHYCEEIQRWSCSATPVHDPITGRTLGVVDVSWPADMLHSDAGALSAMLGVQAETMLRQHLLLEREKLSDIAARRRKTGDRAPVAMIDRYGIDMLDPGSLLQVCGDREAVAALREALPDLLDQPEDRLAADIQSLLPGVDLQILREDGDDIGLLLSKRRSRPAPADSAPTLADMAAMGAAMAQICAQAERLAQSALPVLIEGATGTGKSTLAEAMHRAGPNAHGAFIRLDCSLLSAEGLRRDIAAGLAGNLPRPGGTLFLESPGACPPDAQKLLLGLIEQAMLADMWIVSTSARDLAEATRSGAFRSDLYYRIAVARLAMVPLRERRDEILPHLRAMIRRKNRGGRLLNVTAPALAAITAHDWPGNLREMANLVDLLLATSRSGLVEPRDLPPEFSRSPERGGDTLRDGERAQILEAIALAKGNMTEAARRLGIARSTLYLKLDAHRIERPRRG